MSDAAPPPPTTPDADRPVESAAGRTGHVRSLANPRRLRLAAHLEHPVLRTNRI